MSNGKEFPPDSLPPPPDEGWTVAHDPNNPNKIIYTSPPHPLLTRGPVKIDRPATMKKYIDKGVFCASLLEAMPFKMVDGGNLTHS